MLYTITELTHFQKKILNEYNTADLKEKDTYYERLYFEIKGNLNLKAFCSAINCCIEQFPILRTIFIKENGENKQKILNNYLYQIEVDRSYFNDHDLYKCIDAIVNNKKSIDLNLSSLPPVQFKLYKLKESHYIFSIIAHHILYDGRSVLIFLETLGNKYKLFLKETKIDIAEKNYHDEIYTTRLKTHHFATNQGEQYWKKQLENIHTNSDIPAYHIHDQNVCHNSIYFDFSPEVKLRLKQIAHQNGTTVFIFAMTVFATLLYRYLNMKTLLLWYPADVCPQDLKTQLGFFVNLLPAIFHVDNNLKFNDLLNVTSQQRKESKSYQKYPASKISHIANRHSSNSLDYPFEFIFSQTILKDNLLSLENLSTNTIFPNSNPIRGKIVLRYDNNDDKFLKFRLDFNPNIIDHNFAKNFASHYQNLLINILDNPNLEITKYAFLSTTEKWCLLDDWSGIKLSNEKRQYSLISLFEKSCKEASNKLAIITENTQLTYKQLKICAFNLILKIRAHGINDGSRIIIYSSRNLQAIIAQLAVLYLNCTCIPLDNKRSSDYVNSVIKDSNAKLLLSEYTLPQEFVNNISIPIYPINININDSYFDQDYLFDENECAYILYTSGSTGKAKGVQLCNRAIVSTVYENSPYAIKSTDIISQTSSFSFDYALYQMWGALLNQSTLIIINQAALLSTKMLSQAIERYNINILPITTALFHRLICTDPTIFKTLEILILAGEPINITLMKKNFFCKDYWPKKLVNAYGPTENTIFTTYYEVQWSDVIRGIIPIGKPIQETELYVLDEAKNLVPPYVTGELYITGKRLTLGYLDHHLNTNRFLSLSFKPNDVFFRTGDYVRWLPDGNLDYIGRIDDQVKINGFRVNLMVVQKELNQLTFIKDSFITTLIEQGIKVLIAYIILIDSKEMVYGADIVNFLKHSIPDYMIPYRYKVVSNFPLSLNGKIDRQKLDKNIYNLPFSSSDNLSKLTPTEQNLSNIWKILTQRDTFPIETNLFELGVDSLMLIQACEEINNKLKVNIQPVDLLNAPTIKTLAHYLDKEIMPNQQSDKSVINRIYNKRLHLKHKKNRRS